MRELLERVESIVVEALATPPDRRSAYLDQACAGNEALRREVESLLRFEERATDFLESPVLDRAHWAPVPPDQRHSPDDDPELGRHIGPYRLESRVGAGGMGNVYRARRVDGHFDQIVAVKLIRRGLDTDDVLARFRTERQVLASLQHPNIARLLDGGSTPDGRPYLVMEYVDGEEILAWCDARRLSIDARIDLMRRVCGAVQEAHRRLIVHRDLKPSNILVTADGEPKLLDFGIARVLGTEPTDASRADVTEPASRRLTAAYASPELIAGEPTTTSTDVYSLGVILFELVAGARPRDVASTRVVDAFDSVAREGRIDEVCRARRTTPAALRRVLEGDLGVIAMTALREDPMRRYGSVEQFAEDLNRYRERLPIAARPESLGYRATMFLKRHAVAVAAAGTASVVLLAAVGAIVASSVRAEAARAEAETQRAIADEVNRFLGDMLAAPEPSRLGPDATVREVADIAARRMARGEWTFTHPRVETGVRAALGRTYLSLGLFDEAEPHLASVLASRRADAERSGAASLDLVGVLHDMAGLRLGQARFEESLALFEEALGLRASLPVPGPPHRVEILCNLGHLLSRMGDLETAEARVEEAVLLAEREGGPGSPLMAMALDRLGMVLVRRGDLNGAEPVLRRALAAARAARGEEHHDVANSLSSLGLLVRDRGDMAEAESLLTEAVRVARAVYGENHPTLAVTLSNLAVLYQRTGRMDEAEPLLREALAIRSARLGEDHPDTAATINSLAAMQRARGQLDEAETLYTRALAILRRTFSVDHPDVATVLNNLAAVRYSKADLDGAERTFSEVVAMRRRMLGADHPDLAIALNNLAVTQIERGAAAEAAANLREAEAIQRTKLPSDHPLLAGTLVSLGAALVDLGRFAEAEAVLLEGLSKRRAAAQPNAGQIGAAEILLGLSMQGQGRLEEGASLIESGVARVLAASPPRQQRIALERLVRLSNAFGLPDAAASFLEAIDRLRQ